MKKEFSFLILLILFALTVAINIAFLIGVIVVNSLVNSGALLSAEGLWEYAISVVAINLCLVIYAVFYYIRMKKSK